MTYDEVLKIALKVAESLEKNKSYINELDENLGDGTFGSRLVEAIKKSIEQIHKLDTKELGVVITAIGKIIGKFGGKVGKLYGQTLKEVAEQVSGQKELDLSSLVLITDHIITRLKKKPRDKGTNEHLQFWEEFRKGLEKQKVSDKSMGRIVKDTLNEVKWAFPATRSNAQSLVRVLTIRTIIKNI